MGSLCGRDCLLEKEIYAKFTFSSAAHTNLVNVWREMSWGTLGAVRKNGSAYEMGAIKKYKTRVL